MAKKNPKVKNPELEAYFSKDEIFAQLKAESKRLLRIRDEQQKINLYKWVNLPKGMDGQLIERILYYKGQGAFFYLEPLDQFFFLPYALEGEPDVYGRFLEIQPMIWKGSAAEKDKMFIPGKTYTSVFSPIDPAELKIEDLSKSAVLLKDYTPQMNEVNISRAILQEPILDVMSNLIPYMNTALANSTGVKGMRVISEDQQQIVEDANTSIQAAALTGRKFVPIIGSQEFQELGGDSPARAEEYLLAYQSLDNLRMSLYGIENGGVYEKKAHVLESEQSVNQTNTNLVLEDGLVRRQEFCDIVNSIWGLGIDCYINEQIAGMDFNLDGTIGGEPDHSPTEAATGGTL